MGKSEERDFTEEARQRIVDAGGTRIRTVSDGTGWKADCVINDTVVRGNGANEQEALWSLLNSVNVMKGAR